MRNNRRTTTIVVLLLALAMNAVIAGTASAHEGTFKHEWTKHYRRLAKKTFYAKAIANARFLGINDVAADSDLLDGLDSTAFATSSHTHAGADIVSGTIDAVRIDAAIARVADVFATVLASDGSGSGLDADLLDGQSSAAFQPASPHPVEWVKDSADGLGTTATSERVVFVAPDAITITDVFLVPAAPLTANDTNYATITVSRRDVGGANRVTVASATTQTTGTGNWTAFTAVPLGTLSNTTLSDGQMLTVEIDKSGLGVVVPVMTLQIEYTVN